MRYNDNVELLFAGWSFEGCGKAYPLIGSIRPYSSGLGTYLWLISDGTNPVTD